MNIICCWNYIRDDQKQNLRNHVLRIFVCICPNPVELSVERWWQRSVVLESLKSEILQEEWLKYKRKINIKGYISVKSQELNPESKWPSGFQEFWGQKSSGYATLSFLMFPRKEAAVLGDGVHSVSCLSSTCIHTDFLNAPDSSLPRENSDPCMMGCNDASFDIYIKLPAFSLQDFFRIWSLIGIWPTRF